MQNSSNLPRSANFDPFEGMTSEELTLLEGPVFGVSAGNKEILCEGVTFQEVLQRVHQLLSQKGDIGIVSGPGKEPLSFL